MARTKKALEFPKESCGFCMYYTAKTTESSLCNGFPPLPSVQAEEIVWLRGSPVKASDPACAFFKPKVNG